jgi:hypothetical protein
VTTISGGEQKENSGVFSRHAAERVSIWGGAVGWVDQLLTWSMSEDKTRLLRNLICSTGLALQAWRWPRPS